MFKRLILEPQDGRHTSIHFFLLLLSWIYGLGVFLRSFMYDKGVFKTHRLYSKALSEIRIIRHPPSAMGCPKVISIGNITVGGTGKTPAVIAIARELVKRGIRVTVLSRGYGGSYEHRAGIVSDSKHLRLNPDESGDEPYLLARKLPGVPVIVGRDRIKTGRLAMANFGSQIIILDDAFSHRRIHRDLDIVLINSLNPFGNGRLLPRGILRESLRSLRRADYFILTRADQIADGGWGTKIDTPASKPELINILFRLNPAAPILEAIHRPIDLLDLSGKSHALEMIKGTKILALSSIAAPEHFEAALSKLGASEVSIIRFPDHHPYQEPDIRRLISIFREKKAEAIITTEKDGIRLEGKIKPAEWPFFLMRIEFEIISDPDFISSLCLFGELGEGQDPA
ncbi:MAG: tetraacyldisaccharide 4'-kinase [bacterium]